MSITAGGVSVLPAVGNGSGVGELTGSTVMPAGAKYEKKKLAAPIG